jgi:hypothetical protein
MKNNGMMQGRATRMEIQQDQDGIDLASPSLYIPIVFQVTTLLAFEVFLLEDPPKIPSRIPCGSNLGHFLLSFLVV